ADDRRLARSVEEADLVIYNPKIFPTAPAPLATYAPHTATALSWLFAPEHEITNSAIALRRVREERPATVVDLWSAGAAGANEPLRARYAWNEAGTAAEPPVVRDHWM